VVEEAFDLKSAPVHYIDHVVMVEVAVTLHYVSFATVYMRQLT